MSDGRRRGRLDLGRSVQAVSFAISSIPQRGSLQAERMDLRRECRVVRAPDVPLHRHGQFPAPWHTPDHNVCGVNPAGKEGLFGSCNERVDD